MRSTAKRVQSASAELQVNLRKDRALDALAEFGNVAQFVSFSPDRDGELRVQYSRIAALDPNYPFSSDVEALTCLLESSPERTINLRSYSPESPRSREFVYGLSDISDILATARRLAAEGLFVIANETVDIADGGVSGVVQGDLIEFAPGDTPRCVEKPGVASFPRSMGISILSKVYGFVPELSDSSDLRIEFSIHPKPRGWRRHHTIAWEYEQTPRENPLAVLVWPNRFSRHIGDKVFGLLVAEELGLFVPRTTVISRKVAPFSFGSATGSHEVWTRTAPVEADPGRFTTQKGWTDPYKLLSVEDPSGDSIASVLSQAAVRAQYSGAAIVTSDNSLLIEGQAGEGDALMLGRTLPQPLPAAIIRDVEAVYDHLKETLGPVRFEWVHDGARVWVVQLHHGATQSTATVLVPGDADVWTIFDAALGLEALRSLLAELQPGTGIKVSGQIGATSHVADLLRKSRRPSRIV